MSQSGKTVEVEGHSFQIITEKTKAGVWRAEVVNSVKSAFAFDPEFDSEADAIAHANDALRSTDIRNFLG